jgi:hypothetical protein
MKIQGNSNLPGRVIYNSPKRLADVWPDKQKWHNKDRPEDRDIIKAQVEKIREIYRILRSELFDPERGDDVKVIAPKSFDGGITIEQHLLVKFPPHYSSIIKLACYIEENVNSFPEDPIKRWVIFRRAEVRNLIGNALSNGMDRYTVYTVLGTYLWTQFGKSTEIKEIPGRLIQSYTITKLYNSMGVSAKKVIDIWKNHGISKPYRRTRPSGKYTTVTEVFIPDNNIIFEMTKSAPSFTIPKMRSDTKLKLTIRDDIIPKMNGYFFHHPVDFEGVFNQRVPIIFSNDETVTIPLVENISAAVIAALFTIPELTGLLNHLKANQRAKYIGTIMKHASESVDLISGSLLRFNREIHRIDLTYMDNRDTFHRIITGMSVSGVSVDKELLNKLELETLITKQSSRENAEKERQKILKHLSLTNGILHSQYHLKSRTERVYTRNYNIQGMPKIFHAAVIPDPGYRFIYFDIVANDLTMLFNMIEDHEGLKLLKASKDPYSEIAIEAFGDGTQRDRVKAFVSPFLYGAASETIITQSNDQLNRQDITLLKVAMGKLFPITAEWLDRIRASAVQGLIPKEYNPIDNIEIPIPKTLGPTVGPAMIIQRYGARLFMAIICALARNGYYPKAFVHDSLLIQVPETENLDKVLFEVREEIDLVRSSRGLRAFAIKIGWGESWKAADSAAQYKGLYD